MVAQLVPGTLQTHAHRVTDNNTPSHSFSRLTLTESLATIPQAIHSPTHTHRVTGNNTPSHSHSRLTLTESLATIPQAIHASDSRSQSHWQQYPKPFTLQTHAHRVTGNNTPSHSRFRLTLTESLATIPQAIHYPDSRSHSHWQQYPKPFTLQTHAHRVTVNNTPSHSRSRLTLTESLATIPQAIHASDLRSQSYWQQYPKPFIIQTHNHRVTGNNTPSHSLSRLTLTESLSTMHFHVQIRNRYLSINDSI